MKDEPKPEPDLTKGLDNPETLKDWTTPKTLGSDPHADGLD